MEKGRLTVSVDGESGKPKKTTLEEAEASPSWTSKIKWNLKVQGYFDNSKYQLFEIGSLENTFANQFWQHILYIFGISNRYILKINLRM